MAKEGEFRVFVAAYNPGNPGHAEIRGRCPHFRIEKMTTVGNRVDNQHRLTWVKSLGSPISRCNGEVTWCHLLGNKHAAVCSCSGMYGFYFRSMCFGLHHPSLHRADDSYGDIFIPFTVRGSFTRCCGYQTQEFDSTI